jgi:hypothetical protein
LSARASGTRTPTPRDILIPLSQFRCHGIEVVKVDVNQLNELPHRIMDKLPAGFLRYLGNFLERRYWLSPAGNPQAYGEKARGAPW